MRRPCPGSSGGSCWLQGVGVALWVQPRLSDLFSYGLWAAVGHWGQGESELMVVGQARAGCFCPVVRNTQDFYFLIGERKTDHQFLWLWYREAKQFSRPWPRLSLVSLGKVSTIAHYVQSGAVCRQNLAPPLSLEKTNLLSTHSRRFHLGIVDMSNSFK